MWISIEWNKRLKRWSPRTTKDYTRLRAINAPAYFTMEKYDYVLMLCGNNNMGLETIGYPED